jgi:hypothetical protein
MIETTDNVTIERFNVGEQKAFNIKSTAKAFKILSSNLYTDKVKAIVRELSCNAYDSHIQAKNPNPFRVHIPNTLEPWFCIRDFGVGLSETDIFNVYTTYFESTKTDSNEYIGCLGLGSKSPFSYAENFTVNSYFNGIKYCYTMFINEQGVPNVTLNGSSQTKEPNGLEINIAVLQKDFYYFKTACERVYRHFKILPEITGESIEIKKPVYFLEGQDWGIKNNESRSVKFIMGNVAYELSGYYDENISVSQKSVMNIPIDIFVNIGDLDVSASRENISFDKKTKEFIFNKLASVYADIQKVVQEKINTYAYMYDVKILINQLKRELSYFTFDPFTFKGQKCVFEDGYSMSNDSDSKPDKPKEFRLYSIQKKGRRSSSVREYEKEYFSASTRNAYYFFDTKKHNESRFKKLYWSVQNDDRDEKILILRANEGFTLDDVHNAFVKFLDINPDNFELKKVSDLPHDVPPKKYYSRSSGGTSGGSSGGSYAACPVKYSRTHVPFYDITTANWDYQDGIDETTNGDPNVYVILKKHANTLIEDGSSESISDTKFSCMIGLITDLGISIPKIYGIKLHKKEKTLKENPKLIYFGKWFEATMANYVKKENLIAGLKFRHDFKELRSYHYEKFSVLEQFENYKHILGVIGTIKTNSKKSQKIFDEGMEFMNGASSKNADLVFKFGNIFNPDFLDKHFEGKNSFVMELATIIQDEVYEKYPLLTIIFESPAEDIEKYLTHYLGLFP